MTRTRFDTFDEYASALESEKLTLAHIHAFKQLFNFTVDSGNRLKKSVSDFIIGIKRDGTRLTRVTSAVEVDDETKFYYDPKGGDVYLYDSSADLTDNQVIAEIRYFFANHPVNLAWNLDDDDAEDVHYEPRIIKAPGFKSEVGTDQQGISVTGSGTITLENTDGYFDDFYDAVFFEAKEAKIYSMHRDLLPTEAKLLYRGFIADKSFSDRDISFTIKDLMFKLDQKVPLDLLTESDNVSQQYVGNFKRRVYGRLDGLLLRSLDQVGTGITATGTITNDTVGSQALVGTGTAFLDELTPGDTITIQGLEYQIETVDSDTSATVSDSDGIITVYTGESFTFIPSVPWRKKNREYLVAGHAIKQATTTLVDQLELNRIEVTDASEFEADDIIQVGPTQVSTIKRVSGNFITTRFNMSGLNSPGATVTKEPVQKVFIEGKQIALQDIDTITNTTAGCQITLSEETEFNIARSASLPAFVDFTWTNGTRSVTTTADIDLRELLEARNWVKRSTDADVNFTEILEVREQEILLRTVYPGTTGSGNGSARRPVVVGDDSNVSADVLGKTKDGQPLGDLIKTASEVILDLMEESDLSEYLDTAAFDQASLDASALVSLAMPRNITDTSAPSIRDVVDLMNRSVFGALVLNNDLELAYNILDVSLPSQTLRRIREDDVIKFRIKGKAGRLFKSAVTQYSFLDFDNSTLTDSSRVINHTNDFVEAFETSNKTAELNMQVFEENDAQELTERFVYVNSLSEAVIQLETSLNLADIEMGQQVILDFDRLYKRLGDFSTRLKVGTVIGVDRTGDNVKLKISDLGNLFNRNGVISADDAPEFSASTSEDLMTISHITDERGLVDSNEDTTQNNLIA